MSKTSISAKTGKSESKAASAGRKPRAMTPLDIEAAAKSDPDASPFSAAEFRSARKVPRVKTLRRALALTQEEFAQRFQIPVGTLRDWEQGRTVPDQPALAYLKVIARNPDAVSRALNAAE